ncbi:Protein yippee [Linum grandiflorum]
MASSSSSSSSPKAHQVSPFEHVAGRTYKCRKCNLYITKETQKFNPDVNLAYNNGQADLFKSVSKKNVTYGDAEERTIDELAYDGKEVKCAGCGTVIGWKYLLGEPGADPDRQGKVHLDR